MNSTRFKKKWNVAKGRVRKAAGRDSVSADPEDPDFIEKLNTFRKMRDDYARLQTAAEEVYQAKQELLIKNRELGTILGELSGSAGKCFPAYEALSKVHNNESDINDALNASFSSRVIEPVDLFRNEELKEAATAKSAYTNARMHYDACYNDCNRLQRKGIGGEKLDKAEITMNDAKKELDLSKERFVSAFQESESRRDGSVKDTLKKYLDALAASSDPEYAASTQKLIRTGSEMEESPQSEAVTEDDSPESKADPSPAEFGYPMASFMPETRQVAMTGPDLVGLWKIVSEDISEGVYAAISDTLHVEFSSDPDSVFWFHENDNQLWEVDEWELQMAQPGKNHIRLVKPGHPDQVWIRQEQQDEHGDGSDSSLDGSGGEGD